MRSRALPSSRRRPYAVAVVLALGGFGCLAAPSLRTAHPVPNGAWDLHIIPSGHVIPETTNDGTYGIGLAVAGRVGVNERTDLGFGLHTTGARVDSRIRLTEPGLLTLSVSPGAYVLSYLQENGSGDDIAPVGGLNLLGILTLGHAGRGVSLTGYFGPEAALSDGKGGALARYGGGLRFWIGDSFALHPEVELLSDMGSEFTVVEAALGLGLVFR